jgi:hypothetical protein
VAVCHSRTVLTPTISALNVCGSIRKQGRLRRIIRRAAVLLPIQASRLFLVFFSLIIPYAISVTIAVNRYRHFLTAAGDCMYIRTVLKARAHFDAPVPRDGGGDWRGGRTCWYIDCLTSPQQSIAIRAIFGCDRRFSFRCISR